MVRATEQETPSEETVIKVRGLRNQFGSQVVHDQLDFSVRRGEVMGLVGGSGTGKSVLLRSIVGLLRPAAGSVEIFGKQMVGADGDTLRAVQQRTGVLFQDGALFSSLTVEQNIEVPLKQHTDLSAELRREIAALKISLSGLQADAANKLPAQLSGGMRKRAGLARALALDPDILFLDEPTAGLDPIGAARFDELIADLQHAMGLTVVMVTHDLDSLLAICDRVSVLIDKRVTVGTIEELMRQPAPWIQEYFNGPRGRSAQGARELRDAAGKRRSEGETPREED